jgi:ADP-ribose pyrophosphatase YjhB (NUDIX family)
MSSMRRFVRRAIHLAVGAAYNVRRITWLVSQPQTRGAHAVAFTPDRRLVLVKLSYARGWRLPGGGVKQGERPEQAVLRELQEEIGMSSHRTVRKVSEFQHRPDFRRDSSTLFLVEGVRYEPKWSLEVKEVRAFAVDALPADLAPITRRLLKTAGVG